MRGIFDFDNAENPVRDDAIVFIPYCSGDVHAGATDVEYPSRVGGPPVTVHHRGAINANAALSWTYANFPTPKQVIVAGSGIGSIYHSAQVMRNYPTAQVAQLSDGFVGVMPPGWEALKVWDVYANLPTFIPELANADPETFTVNAIYTATAKFFPQRMLAQFTHAADSFQTGYYGLTGGNIADWYTQRERFLGELRAPPNFRSFVGAGIRHTILAGVRRVLHDGRRRRPAARLVRRLHRLQARRQRALPTRQHHLSVTAIRVRSQCQSN